MEIVTISFDGCSCGCTPYESYTINGTDEDIIKAGAQWVNDHRVYGDDPYRKISFSSNTLKKAILDKATEVNVLETQENEKSKKLEANARKVQEFHNAAKTLNILIPRQTQDAILSLQNENAILEKEIEELKARIRNEYSNKAKEL